MGAFSGSQRLSGSQIRPAVALGAENCVPIRGAHHVSPAHIGESDVNPGPRRACERSETARQREIRPECRQVLKANKACPESGRRSFPKRGFWSSPHDPPSMGGLLYLGSSIKSTRAWARAPGCEDPPTPYPISILLTWVLTCNDDATDRVSAKPSRIPYATSPIGMEYTETVWPTICPFLRRPWVRDADQ